MKTYDHFDARQQEQLLWSHPLVTTNYVALTPSMPKVLGMVMEHVTLHKRSLVFKAFPRMGKTTICNFVVSALDCDPTCKDRFALLISADTNGEPKRRESIVMILAKSLGLRLSTRATLASIRTDALNDIESRLRNRAGRHWVLFLDELQTLTIEDFEHLQFIQNKLALHNIDTTLIGFSQTQIEHTITLLEKQKRAELIVRFLNEVWDLPYCTDHNWMSETLKGYDDHFTYPAGSGCSYTQFFLPQAYAAGFRLNVMAPDIYQVMSAAVKTVKLPLLPTSFVFEIFRLILIRSMKQDAPDFTVTQEIIESVTKESKLSNYVEVIKNSGVL
jgi:hypothetical protein